MRSVFILLLATSIFASEPVVPAIELTYSGGLHPAPPLTAWLDSDITESVAWWNRRSYGRLESADAACTGLGLAAVSGCIADGRRRLAVSRGWHGATPGRMVVVRLDGVGLAVDTALPPPGWRVAMLLASIIAKGETQKGFAAQEEVRNRVESLRPVDLIAVVETTGRAQVVLTWSQRALTAADTAIRGRIPVDAIASGAIALLAAPPVPWAELELAQGGCSTREELLNALGGTWAGAIFADKCFILVAPASALVSRLALFASGLVVEPWDCSLLIASDPQLIVTWKGLRSLPTRSGLGEVGLDPAASTAVAICTYIIQLRDCELGKTCLKLVVPYRSRVTFEVHAWYEKIASIERFVRCRHSLMSMAARVAAQGAGGPMPTDDIALTHVHGIALKENCVGTTGPIMYQCHGERGFRLVPDTSKLPPMKKWHQWRSASPAEADARLVLPAPNMPELASPRTICRATI